MAKEVKAEKKVDEKVEALKKFEATHEATKKLYPAEYEVLKAEFDKQLGRN